MGLDAVVQESIVCGFLSDALIVDEPEASITLSAGAVVDGEYRLMRDRLPSPVVLGVGILSNQAFVVPDQVQFGLAADGGQVRTRMQMLSRITGCVPTVKMVDRTEVQGAVRGGDELPFLFDSVDREDQRVFVCTVGWLSK